MFSDSGEPHPDSETVDATPAMPVHPGSSIGPYKLLQKIGEGGAWASCSS